MSTETDLPPLPWIERYFTTGDARFRVASDPDGNWVTHEDHEAAMQAYARACVSSATEALRLRLHRIETGLTEQISFHVGQVEEAEARAERLTGELLTLCNVIDGHDVPTAVEAQAAFARNVLSKEQP